MKALRFFNLAVLFVLIGTASLVYAQDERQEDKPARQEETKQDEARPPKQDEAKPPKQDEAKSEKQEKQDMKRDQQHGQPAGKGRIPDDKFRAHFGRSHTFTAKTVIVQGQPQFRYGGYNFQLVDAWPVGWAYTDECYIDFIDGEYFLFDLLHPGVRIAVFVVL